MKDVIKELLSNTPNPQTAFYHLGAYNQYLCLQNAEDLPWLKSIVGLIEKENFEIDGYGIFSIIDSTIAGLEEEPTSILVHFMKNSENEKTSGEFRIESNCKDGVWESMPFSFQGKPGSIKDAVITL